MDPNQNSPTPEPQQVPETPISPQAAPVFQQNTQFVSPVESATSVIDNPSPMAAAQPESSAQPFSPIVPVEQSEMTTPQSVTSSEVFGAAPQVANADTANQPKKSNKKVFILLGIFVVLLIGAGIAAWLLFLS